MESILSTSIIGHLMLGPLILVIALLYKFYPPKKINSLYGFRTPLSMKNEDTWKEGNRYGANAMVAVALLTIVIQVLSEAFIQNTNSIMISVVVMCVALLGSVIATSIHLNRVFDKDGNRK